MESVRGGDGVLQLQAQLAALDLHGIAFQDALLCAAQCVSLTRQPASDLNVCLLQAMLLQFPPVDEDLFDDVGALGRADACAAAGARILQGTEHTR